MTLLECRQSRDFIIIYGPTHTTIEKSGGWKLSEFNAREVRKNNNKINHWKKEENKDKCSRLGEKDDEYGGFKCPIIVF